MAVSMRLWFLHVIFQSVAVDVYILKLWSNMLKGVELSFGIGTIFKFQKLDTNLKIVPIKKLHVKPNQKIIRRAVIFKKLQTENSTVVYGDCKESLCSSSQRPTGVNMSNAVVSSRKSNSTRRIRHLRAAPLGYSAGGPC